MALIVISIVSVLFTACYAGVFIFFIKGWLRLPYFVPKAGRNYTAVSILIAARNEAERINLTIDDLLAQDYPVELIEIIIVDDHSTDNTAEIIQSYSSRGVKLLKLNEDEPLNSYKKKAITEAVKLSNGELIVATDADCRMGVNWLKTIVSFYEEYSNKLISSPVAFFEERNLFERLQTVEFISLIGIGASSIGNGVPTTCNGANMAYQRSVFLELNGFQGIDDLASGDDELFLHKVSKKYPDGIGFCKNTEAVVYTHAKPNLREFIRQRKRWASKSTRYKNKRIVILGITLWFSNLLLILNLLLGLYNNSYFFLACLCFMMKFMAELSFIKHLLSFTCRKKLLILMPFLSFVHIVYLVFIGLAGNSGKYYWKGRFVK